MNLEQLKKLFGEQPALFKEVLGHIATTEEGKEFLANYAKVEVDKAKSDLTSEIYNNIDKDMREVLGVEKPGDKKTWEAVKEILVELKGLRDKPKGEAGTETEKDTKINELEGKLKTLVDANWEGKYNTLVTETSTKVTELTGEITKLKTGSVESLVGMELATGLSTLKFNPNIPTEAVTAMTEQVKARIMKTAKVVEGKVVYYKEDGTPYLNELFQPITAEGIFKNELKSIISGVNVSGGGSEAGKGTITTIGEGDNAKKKLILDPSKFTTKLGFAQHAEDTLLELGVAKNSDEWHGLVADARTEYGVDKMERI